MFPTAVSSHVKYIPIYSVIGSTVEMTKWHYTANGYYYFSEYPLNEQEAYADRIYLPTARWNQGYPENISTEIMFIMGWLEWKLFIIKNKRCLLVRDLLYNLCSCKAVS
jgi:hypothetical protein